MTKTGVRSIPSSSLTRFAVLASLCFATACSNAMQSPDVAGLPGARTQWWRDGVCYEVFVRSFADADGDGIGDLRGLTARLDYINDGNPASTSSLGANCIWLMPIAKSVSYHGYDVADYYHVDPHYGSDEDFRSLVREAHRRGIHVIVDFVPNHSSSEHPFFQAALHDTASPYRDWYRWSSVKPEQPPTWGQEVWHKSPARDEYYYGLFWGGMPDLNYRTPAVLQEMQKVTAYWLKEMHADGFRFDAIPYLVEQGNQLAHTRGTHDVLRQFGNAIRSEAPESFTIGEMSDGSAQVLATYYPDQLDAYFAFGVAGATVEAARTGNAAAFSQAVGEANVMFPAGRWSPFLTNHDQPRVMTVLGGDPAKARVAASAMLMLPGLAFVYYGEEIGMVGTKPDETIRTPMQWSSARNGGFTTGTPWEPLQADWKTKNVAAQDSSRQSLLDHYRKLIQLRNAHPALNRGSLALLRTNDTTGTIAAWLRSSRDEAFVIVINFGRRHGQLHIERPPPNSLPGGGEYHMESAYADPDHACAGYPYLNGNGSILVSSMEANGFCALRIRRR